MVKFFFPITHLRINWVYINSTLQGLVSYFKGITWCLTGILRFLHRQKPSYQPTVISLQRRRLSNGKPKRLPHRYSHRHQPHLLTQITTTCLLTYFFQCIQLPLPQTKLLLPVTFPHILQSFENRKLDKYFDIRKMNKWAFWDIIWL